MIEHCPHFVDSSGMCVYCKSQIFAPEDSFRYNMPVSKPKKNNEKEILLLIMEECAEVQQAISKILRFGLDTSYKGKTNRQQLESELGDLLCLVSLLCKEEVVDDDKVKLAKDAKKKRLEKWSNLEID